MSSIDKRFKKKAKIERIDDDDNDLGLSDDCKQDSKHLSDQEKDCGDAVSNDEVSEFWNSLESHFAA